MGTPRPRPPGGACDGAVLVTLSSGSSRQKPEATAAPAPDRDRHHPLPPLRAIASRPPCAQPLPRATATVTDLAPSRTNRIVDGANVRSLRVAVVGAPQLHTTTTDPTAVPVSDPPTRPACPAEWPTRFATPTPATGAPPTRLLRRMLPHRAAPHAAPLIAGLPPPRAPPSRPRPSPNCALGAANPLLVMSPTPSGQSGRHSSLPSSAIASTARAARGASSSGAIGGAGDAEPRW